MVQTMTKRNYINKKDFLIIVAILLIALISYFIYSNINKKNSNEFLAEILIDGEIYKTVSLKDDEKFSIEQKPYITFEIKNNKIRFLNSDCKDKICVNTGFIGSNGQMAVCLPNKISLRIIPKNENSIENIDMVI